MYRSVGREYSDEELERESLGTMVDMETVQGRRSEHAHAHSSVYLVRLVVESCDDTNVRIRRHINTVIYVVILLYTYYLYENINTKCSRLNLLSPFADSARTLLLFIFPTSTCSRYIRPKKQIKSPTS